MHMYISYASLHDCSPSTTDPKQLKSVFVCVCVCVGGVIVGFPFITQKRSTFGVPNSSQSPDIGQSPDGGISDFRVSGQSLIKENCNNSRTSDNIDMKLGLVTKFDKRNKILSKNINDDVISENYDVIAIFPDFGRIVYKINIFINSNLLSCKNWKQN